VAVGSGSNGSFLVLHGVLLVPLSFTVALSLYTYAKTKIFELRRAFVLGFSLPLALGYIIIIFAWPRGTTISFGDALAWRATVVILLMPQVLPLLLIGVMVWRHFYKQQRTNNLTVIITAVIVVVGHSWTTLVLGGLAGSSSGRW
jgi:hypothetical protein